MGPGPRSRRDARHRDPVGGRLSAPPVTPGPARRADRAFARPAGGGGQVVLPRAPTRWHRDRALCLRKPRQPLLDLIGRRQHLGSARGGRGERVGSPRRPSPTQGGGAGRGGPGAHLDAVLLQVQVPSVDRDAGRDLRQLSPRADHPAGLVAAGAGCGAGGGRRGAPSGSQGQGHAAPAGPQGWGEEPEEEQGPMGPGHPTGRQWGARGAAGARHPQCSCSARAPGGCRGERRRGWVSVWGAWAACPLPSPQLWAVTSPPASRLTPTPLGRLYAHFTEPKTEAGPEDVLAQGHGARQRRSQPDATLSSWQDFKKAGKWAEMKGETEEAEVTEGGWGVRQGVRVGSWPPAEQPPRPPVTRVSLWEPTPASRAVPSPHFSLLERLQGGRSPSACLHTLHPSHWPSHARAPAPSASPGPAGLTAGAGLGVRHTGKLKEHEVPARQPRRGGVWPERLGGSGGWMGSRLEAQGAPVDPERQGLQVKSRELEGLSWGLGTLWCLNSARGEGSVGSGLPTPISTGG